MDFQPSTFRIVIRPEASKAQNSIAAVSALGRTVCVLIRRLNSSCSRSMAYVVRIEPTVHRARCWRGGLLADGRFTPPRPYSVACRTSPLSL